MPYGWNKPNERQSLSTGSGAASGTTSASGGTSRASQCGNLGPGPSMYTNVFQSMYEGSGSLNQGSDAGL